MYRETLDEYMASYEEQEAKIERYNNRIEEIVSEVRIRKRRKTWLLPGHSYPYRRWSLFVETGDFKRFAKGNTYAAFPGLIPREHSSSENMNRPGISKAGNIHLRCLLI